MAEMFNLIINRCDEDDAKSVAFRTAELKEWKRRTEAGISHLISVRAEFNRMEDAWRKEVDRLKHEIRECEDNPDFHGHSL